MTAHDHATVVPGCYRCELGADEAHAVEVETLRDLLTEVATSGVTFDDARVGYVEVQINRVTWDAIQTAAA